MLTAGQLLHQPPQDLNAAFYNRNPSLSNSRTGGSSSVLPVAGVPNLFPQVLPPGRRDTQDGSEDDWATLLLDNNSLDEGDCSSVRSSSVRKEAESGAPVQEDNSIGSSITPINWPSGFQNGRGAGTDHDDYYGNTSAAGEAVDAVPDFVDADIYRFHPGLDDDEPMDAPDNGEVPGDYPVMEPCDFEPISHGHLERVQTYLLVLMKRFQGPLEAYDTIMDWAEFATSEPSFDFRRGSVGNKRGSVVAALTKKMGMEGL